MHEAADGKRVLMCCSLQHEEQQREHACTHQLIKARLSAGKKGTCT